MAEIDVQNKNNFYIFSKSMILKMDFFLNNN